MIYLLINSRLVYSHHFLTLYNLLTDPPTYLFISNSVLWNQDSCLQFLFPAHHLLLLKQNITGHQNNAWNWKTFRQLFLRPMAVKFYTQFVKLWWQMIAVNIWTRFGFVIPTTAIMFNWQKEIRTLPIQDGARMASG